MQGITDRIGLWIKFRTLAYKVIRSSTEEVDLPIWIFTQKRGKSGKIDFDCSE